MKNMFHFTVLLRTVPVEGLKTDSVIFHSPAHISPVTLVPEIL